MDSALVENQPADELDVKVAHAQVALGGLPGEGEGHGEKLVQGSPLLVLLLELPVGGGEVGELLHLGLEAVHRLHHLLAQSVATSPSAISPSCMKGSCSMS